MTSAYRLLLAFTLVVFGFLLIVTTISFLIVVGFVLVLGGLLLLSSWAFERRTVRRVGEASPPTVSDSLGSRTAYGRLLDTWRVDAGGMSIDLLRIGIGLVWTGNMIFIVDPANQFFATFPDVALSYGLTTLGGPGLANFVAANSTVFAWLTVLVSAYLALAFILGVTTRLACLVGAAASLTFFWTQFWSTFQIPGGTDVGAHPLYLIIYLVLFIGGAGKYLALDRLMWTTGRARFPRLSRWLATPRP